MFNKFLSLTGGLMLLFAAAPASNNYTLESFGVGSGGTSNAGSSAYSMEGITGEASGTQLSSSAYKMDSGLIGTQLAHTPAAPTLSNPNNYYNKLHLVIDTGGNPSDATFAIAISSDNFSTTQYVQDDHSVGSALGAEDFQTYTLWGSTTGFDIIGLSPNTTYAVKVKAAHGKYTESGFGSSASLATANPTLTFDLDVSASNTETSPPYTVAFSDLLPGSVVDSPQKIWVDFDTNGATGGNVYVFGANAGLKSLKTSYTIASSTGDLSSLSQGFGAQSSSATQSSGGPFTSVSPYNGSSQSVGITDTNIRKAYTSTLPLVGGRSALLLKAKATNVTPSSNDYAEVLTVLAAMNF